MIITSFEYQHLGIVLQGLAKSGAIRWLQQVHVDCLRYCFMPLIQKELDGIAREWNAHRTRPSQHAEAPGGIRDILYFAPETQGLQKMLYS